MFVRESMTFAEAEKNCEEKGAKLVEMWSLTEWKEITEWIKKNFHISRPSDHSWVPSWVGLKGGDES